MCLCLVWAALSCQAFSELQSLGKKLTSHPSLTKHKIDTRWIIDLNLKLNQDKKKNRKLLHDLAVDKYFLGKKKHKIH